MGELGFEITQEPDGGYCAACLTESIFTQGDNWEELRTNVLDATSAYYFDRTQYGTTLIERSNLGVFGAQPRPLAAHETVP